MNSTINHFSTITQHLESLGKPAPEHPLFAYIDVKIDEKGFSTDCPDFEIAITTDFYIISLKKIIAGQILYGKTECDARSGTMIFVAPGQQLRTYGIRLKSEGHIILIHPDFFLGHSFEETTKRSAFFEYDIHESLHLSPSEEEMIFTLFNGISKEYHGRYDDSSRDIMLS